MQITPLLWPPHVPRSTPIRGRFSTCLIEAIENVRESVRLFGADTQRSVVRGSITFEPAGKDPAVAVYFTWDAQPTCIAVDRYGRTEDNLQAIHHCLEAERVKMRHGGLTLVQATMKGLALPPAVIQPMASDIISTAREVYERPIEVVTPKPARMKYLGQIKQWLVPHGS